MSDNDNIKSELNPARPTRPGQTPKGPLFVQSLVGGILFAGGIGIILEAVYNTKSDGAATFLVFLGIATGVVGMCVLYWLAIDSPHAGYSTQLETYADHLEHTIASLTPDAQLWRTYTRTLASRGGQQDDGV